MKLKKLILLSTMLLVQIGLMAETKGTRPNIIVILADDLGYADVGFNRAADFPEEMGIIPTPNIDALAHQGIIASNAHVVHPFCGPSRVGIMTGMYPHRVGAQYNLPNDISTTYGIDESATYFPAILQENDYNTAAYGKWHLGFIEGKYQPLDRGFDEFFGFCGGGKNYFRSEYDNVWYKYSTSSAAYNDPELYNEAKDNHTTNEYLNPIRRNRDYVDRKEFGLDEYLTDILTDEVIDYIDRKVKDTIPFFQYVAYNAPHTPLQAPEDEIAAFKAANPNFENAYRNGDYLLTAKQVTKYTDPTERQEKIDYYVENRVIYGTMVSILDRNIGRIVQKLEDEGIMDNTMIIFFSDNGGYTYSKGAVNYPLDALKGSVDEGGHRIPFFVHWPDQIKTPSVYPYQISSTDLYPTCVELAGGTVPSDQTLDGKYFIDKMMAGEEVRPDEPLHVLRPQNGFHNAAIMSYPYRVTRKGGNGAWKLYDVRVNPQKEITGPVDNTTATAIINDLVAKGADWAKGFVDVMPGWFDHDRGDGHPHRILWFGEDLAGNTAAPVFPGLDKTYNDASVIPGQTSGIDAIIENMVSVYPNPSTGRFSVSFDTSIKNLDMELISQSGQVLKKVQTSCVGTSSIDATDLPGGMYIIRIKADDSLTIEKVIRL